MRRPLRRYRCSAKVLMLPSFYAVAGVLPGLCAVAAPATESEADEFILKQNNKKAAH